MSTATQTPVSGESFAALFQESLTRQDMRSGEVISAEVVRIDHNFVIVNAGLKSEAFIPIEEFKNDSGEIEVVVGDFVSVAIESLENGFGRPCGYFSAATFCQCARSKGTLTNDVLATCAF